jgi:hypothetical protein
VSGPADHPGPVPGRERTLIRPDAPLDRRVDRPPDERCDAVDADRSELAGADCGEPAVADRRSGSAGARHGPADAGSGDAAGDPRDAADELRSVPPSAAVEWALVIGRVYERLRGLRMRSIDLHGGVGGFTHALVHDDQGGVAVIRDGDPGSPELRRAWRVLAPDPGTGVRIHEGRRTSTVPARRLTDLTGEEVARSRGDLGSPGGYHDDDPR